MVSIVDACPEPCRVPVGIESFSASHARSVDVLDGSGSEVIDVVMVQSEVPAAATPQKLLILFLHLQYNAAVSDTTGTPTMRIYNTIQFHFDNYNATFQFLY